MNEIFEDDYVNTFITIIDPNGGFLDILDEFENELETLNVDRVIIDKAFPTKLVVNLEGYKEEVLEACGNLIQILLSYGVSYFNFSLQGIEELDV